MFLYKKRYAPKVLRSENVSKIEEIVIKRYAPKVLRSENVSKIEEIVIKRYSI